ncbi:hypothetical protein CsSME_00004091 [Camellia sinensis var. sinensis]
MEISQSLLQRYRSDRRQLLSFILSSGLIRELRSPTGPTSSVSDSDLELLSADYVLQCAQSGSESCLCSPWNLEKKFKTRHSEKK